MKVYVVTAGEYSNYHIEAIFTDETVANQYANLDSDRNVEEYETDIESINPDPDKLVYHVTYDFETDKIKTLCLTAGCSRGDDFVYDYQTVFNFYVSPSETLDNSIRMFGHNSDWLLKIAQDRFYMYCDAHETSRQELIQRKRDRYKRYEEMYPMYTTSTYATVDFRNYLNADAQCNEILHGMIADGINLPTSEDLYELRRELLKKTVEENVSINEHD